MPLWKLTLAYDGTHLHGWQVQPGLATVQGHLQAALKRLTGESVLPQGSGRTDAGVHALAQVASFVLAAPIPPANLLRALNRILPSSIRVLSAALVLPPFHARHSARAKTYLYRLFPRRPPMHLPPQAPLSAPGEIASSHPILTDPSTATVPDRICPPTLAPFVWDCPTALSLDRLNQAATHILGRHDFTSFAASGSDALNPAAPPFVPADPLPDYPATPPTPWRTIYEATWSRTPVDASASGGGPADPFSTPELLTFRITGSGFLHHMVRNLVGTFVLAGSGRLPPDSIPSILAARSRSAAGPTAPASGLFLAEVHYS